MKVATIIKAQGIKGEIKVRPLIELEEIVGANSLSIEGEDYAVLNARAQSGFVFLALKGVTTRNQAELLVGKDVFVEQASLSPLKEGEYYIKDMVGVTLFDTDGNLLGTIKSVDNFGSLDIITVISEASSLSFPHLKRLELTFDFENKRASIDANKLSEVAVFNSNKGNK